MTFRRPPLVLVALPSTIYPMTCDGVTAWVTETLQFRKVSYERLFDQYIEALRVAEGTAAALTERLRKVGFGYAGMVSVDMRILDQRRFDVSLAAETLMLPLDAFLTSLRCALTGDETCTDDGPELRNGVTVDRAVDAVGNYVRHRDGWFAHDFADTWPSKRQMRSVQPLAQLRSSTPLHCPKDAYIEFTSIPLVAAYVLDLLGDYENLGPGMLETAARF